MSNRHQKIGFKQIVRLEWMDRTLSLVLAGLSEKEIRSNLEEYLSTQRQSGGEGQSETRPPLVCQLSSSHAGFEKNLNWMIFGRL